MKLSVLLSGIRTQNWLELYKSIYQSYSGNDWEMIIVSPYPLPPELLYKPNIEWIQDWGSPCRCQQIALIHAIGDYIIWAADDGVFTEGSIDKGFELLKGEDYKTIIIGKYLEGNEYSEDMKTDSYYMLHYHKDSICKYIPLETPLLNVGLVSRQLLNGLGGWDASKFEALPIAYNDLAVRCTKYACKFIHQKEIMFTCSHTPGTTGDHGPIHTAQKFKDTPMFQMIYSKPSDRMVIDINNWETSPSRWTRRFGDERIQSKT